VGVLRRLVGGLSSGLGGLFRGQNRVLGDACGLDRVIGGLGGGGVFVRALPAGGEGQNGGGNGDEGGDAHGKSSVCMSRGREPLSKR